MKREKIIEQTDQCIDCKHSKDCRFSLENVNNSCKYYISLTSTNQQTEYNILDKRQNPEDWIEDYPHENGYYMNTCTHCGIEFMGYKRRVCCKKCSQPQKADSDKGEPCKYCNGLGYTEEGAIAVGCVCEDKGEPKQSGLSVEEWLTNYCGKRDATIPWSLMELTELLNQFASTGKESEDEQELNQRLQDGRHYLMGVQSDEITVSDALEAFGFGRNGLNSTEQ